MEQNVIEKEEIPSWNQIREMMYLTSQTIRQMNECRQAECEKRQAEYAEYERRSREAEERRQAEYEKRQAEYAEYERRSREAEERRQAEYEKRQAAFEKSKEEYDKRTVLAQVQMEELRQQMKDVRAHFKELSTKYSSQIGHVVEGLMEPSALALFQQSGFDICKCWKGMKGKRKDLGLKMEIDLFLHDTTEAVAVEVKTNCLKDDVDHFLKQMEKFSIVFPEYANVNVYLAMAAINYDRESDKYATEKGLFVIRVSDDAFILDPAKKEDMTYFCMGEIKRGK